MQLILTATLKYSNIMSDTKAYYFGNGAPIFKQTSAPKPISNIIHEKKVFYFIVIKTFSPLFLAGVRYLSMSKAKAFLESVNCPFMVL